MLVNSFLVQGDGSALAGRLHNVVSKPLDALVLMSLGADIPKIVDTVHQTGASYPVYLTETYGIIGYDEDLGRNVELMEKGRGSEYGFRGGSGGQGCLALAFSDGAVSGHTASFPSEISSLMVIADTSGEFGKVSSGAPLHYGGITKKAWVVSHDGENSDLEQVPYFWIASKDPNSAPVGVSAFTGDASEAAMSLLSKIPSDWSPSGEVGLFPCYTRGVNKYGKENVESNAISVAMSESSPLHIYGMFAHGELGPSSYSGFASEIDNIACEKHSGTSILSIHTANVAPMN